MTTLLLFCWTRRLQRSCVLVGGGGGGRTPSPSPPASPLPCVIIRRQPLALLCMAAVTAQRLWSRHITPNIITLPVAAKRQTSPTAHIGSDIAGLRFYVTVVWADSAVPRWHRWRGGLKAFAPLSAPSSALAAARSSSPSLSILVAGHHASPSRLHCCTRPPLRRRASQRAEICLVMNIGPSAAAAWSSVRPAEYAANAPLRAWPSASRSPSRRSRPPSARAAQPAWSSVFSSSPSSAAPGVTMPESERGALSTLMPGNNTAHDFGHAPCSAAPPADVPAGQCYVGRRARAWPSLLFGASVSRLALLFVPVIIIHVRGAVVAVQHRRERNTTISRPWKPAAEAAEASQAMLVVSLTGSFAPSTCAT